MKLFSELDSLCPRGPEPIAVLDVAFAIDTLAYLNRLKEARVWVRRVTRRENLSVDSWEGGVLLSRMAEFYAKVCDFEQAIRLLEPLRTHRGIDESAILGIVELRVAQGLRAIQEGLTALREMNASPDPELAVAAPGNEQARWSKTEKRLKRLEKQLKNALPKERQKEFGV